MAITGDAFDSTELQYVIPEMWTPIIHEALFAKTTAANFFTDLSEFAADGGDIFHIPDAFTNTFTAKTQSTQGAEITTEAPATAEQQLDVDTHSYVAILFGDKDLQQVAKKYGITQVYVRQAVGTLDTVLEAALYGLWSSLSTNTVGDTATILSDAEIRSGIQKMDALNYNLNDLAFHFHPYTFWQQLAAITKYYDQSVHGGPSFVRDGNFGPMDMSAGLRGSLYGVPVYVSSNVVSGLQTYRNLLATPDAFAFALQTPGGSKVKVNTTYENRNLAWLTTISMIYGVSLSREPAGCLLNASSTFINS